MSLRSFCRGQAVLLSIIYNKLLVSNFCDLSFVQKYRVMIGRFLEVSFCCGIVLNMHNGNIELFQHIMLHKDTKSLAFG